jgi:hypothetical protein
MDRLQQVEEAFRLVRCLRAEQDEAIEQQVTGQLKKEMPALNAVIDHLLYAMMAGEFIADNAYLLPPDALEKFTSAVESMMINKESVLHESAYLQTLKGRSDG